MDKNRYVKAIEDFDHNDDCLNSSIKILNSLYGALTLMDTILSIESKMITSLMLLDNIAEKYRNVVLLQIFDKVLIEDDIVYFYLTNILCDSELFGNELILYKMIAKKNHSKDSVKSLSFILEKLNKKHIENLLIISLHYEDINFHNLFRYILEFEFTLEKSVTIPEHVLSCFTEAKLKLTAPSPPAA